MPLCVPLASVCSMHAPAFAVAGWLNGDGWVSYPTSNPYLTVQLSQPLDDISAVKIWPIMDVNNGVSYNGVPFLQNLTIYLHTEASFMQGAVCADGVSAASSAAFMVACNGTGPRPVSYVTLRRSGSSLVLGLLQVQVMRGESSCCAIQHVRVLCEDIRGATPVQ